MPLTKVSDLAEIKKQTWSPSSSEDSQVLHFSIPNYDLGEAFLEDSSTLKSNKNLISDPCVLVSKLNPSTPRVWLVESAPTHTAVSSTEFIALRPKDPSDLFALYFALKSPRAVSRLSEQATGTSNSHQRVRPHDILDLDLDLVGDRVALDSATNFLWSLERKIALNKGISETLESIAQALFRSWFVDFDPVRAKMRGEKPVGMDDLTAALFPDSMEESELGEIPAGWTVRSVGEIFDVKGGGTPKTSNVEFWDGDIHWLTPKDLARTKSTVSLSSSRRITMAGLATITSGLLPVGTVLLSSRAPIGYVTICEVPTAINQGFIALPANEGFPPLFNFFWLKANLEEILNRAGGTTFPEISKKSFREIPFVVPDPRVVEAYANVATPIEAQLVELHKQTEALTGIRDSLLPRLISGELQVPEDLVA